MLTRGGATGNAGASKDIVAWSGPTAAVVHGARRSREVAPGAAAFAGGPTACTDVAGRTGCGALNAVGSALSSGQPYSTLDARCKIRADGIVPTTRAGLAATSSVAVRGAPPRGAALEATPCDAGRVVTPCGATLRGAMPCGAMLDGAMLDGSTLRDGGATLDGGGTLPGATLDGATLDGATLDGGTLRG